MSPQKPADLQKKLLQQAEGIQPHGVLFALNSQFCIEYCSENVNELLQLPYTDVLGRSFAEFASAADIEQIRSLNGLGDWRSSAVLSLHIRRGDTFVNHDAAVSYSNHHWLVELELQTQDQSMLFNQVFVPTRDLLWQLNREQNLHNYTRKVVELVRQVSGYDQVMMYQFDHNRDGEVIAESRSAQMSSYLGNRFQASDISARALTSYTHNLTWVTANVNCVTVPVHACPKSGTDQILDMTYSAYRSLPPVHLKHLENMGVAATLTISLIQNGRLWGMLTCHHHAPRKVTLREWELYEFIGRTVSIKLPDLQRNEQQKTKERVTRFLLDAPEKQLDALDPTNSVELMSILDATGVVLVSNGQHYAYGQTPTAQQMFDLEQYLKQLKLTRLFHTNDLAQLHPPAQSYAEVACGILLAPLNHTMKNYLLWCRGPKSQTQTHHKKSDSWTSIQIEAAENLGYAFIKQLGRQSQPPPERDFRKRAVLSNDMTVRLQNNGTIGYVSSIVKTLLGQSADSLQGTSFISLLNDEGADAFEQAQQVLQQTGVTQKITFKLQHTDRHSVWVEATMWQPGNDTGPGHGVVLTVHDISQRQKYQMITEELHQRNNQLQQAGRDQQQVTSQTFLDQTSEVVVITGADGLIQSVNRSFCEITGYTAQEAIGRNPSILQSGIHTALFYKELWYSLGERGHWKGEIWNRRKNGEVYPQLGSISIVRNDDGSVRNYVAVFSDVSKAKEAESHLFFAQNHDLLTSLPNRQYCLEKVGQMVAERPPNGPGMAVVFLDIDRFKLLNDARGHHTGDSFLRVVAQRLTEACPKDGLLCRWGADEFVLVLAQVIDRDSIAIIVQTLFNTLTKPLSLGDHELTPSACVGISFFPEDAADAQGLIQAAETALYRAKERGPASIELFTPLLAERLYQKFEVASELRRAIQNNELTLNYQPQIDCKTGTLAGVEALVRWQHPVKGLMSPATFIPLTEELGLIGLLGDCVLNKAMAQMARWRSQGQLIPRVAVNIAPQQLVPGFADHIRDLLNTYQLPASLLELEITEGALERDESNIKLLQTLRDMGVYLSIDDFGTGYSSLAHIKHLPINCFKIDKVFVDGLPDNAFDVAIIRTVLALGHSLGIRVLAEGVETKEQYLFLAEQDVDCIQGYYFGRPMEASALEQWMAARDKG